jgi:membrane protein
MTGLNAVYGAEEHRGYFRTRLISMVYLFSFLLMLLMTLVLHIFGQKLAVLLEQTLHPGLLILGKLIHFRFWVLLLLQTVFFTAMFMVLPDEKNSFRESVPGALLAALDGSWYRICTASIWNIFRPWEMCMAPYMPLRWGCYGCMYARALYSMAVRGTGF